MSQIFISYGTKDIRFVRDITTELDRNGITYWMAPENVPNEDKFGGQIIKGIRGADVFLVVISSSSQQSRNVLHELSYADRQNKYIIPFFIEDCEVTDEFEYYLAGKNHLHAELDFCDAMNRLMSIIRYLEANDYPQKPRYIRCPQCGSFTLTEHEESRLILQWVVRIMYILAVLPYLYLSLYALTIILPLYFVGMLIGLSINPIHLLKSWLKISQKLLNKIKYPLSTKYWNLRCSNCMCDFAIELEVQDRRKDLFLELVSTKDTNLLPEKSIDTID